MPSGEDSSKDAKSQLALDALQPATKDFGQTVRPLGHEAGELVVDAARVGIRTVRVLLAPVRATVWGAEQIKDWLEETIERKLSKVPEDRLIEPPLMIAGPTVDAMRYAGSEPDLRQLFANLLANAMDASTVQVVHPAFVEVIKQLAPNEARILRLSPLR